MSQPADDDAGPRTDAGGPDATYSIGDLAEEFSITTRTIRFYESRGLIAPSRVGANRIYSRRDRARLMLILRGKNLGFSLEDIGEYLSLYDTDPNQIAQTRLLLDKVDGHIAGLMAKKADLERALRELKEIRNQCLSFIRSARRNGGSQA